MRKTGRVRIREIDVAAKFLFVKLTFGSPARILDEILAFQKNRQLLLHRDSKTASTFLTPEPLVVRLGASATCLWATPG
jgi:hypothetical protein